jgi:hypothetical protein
MHGNLAVTWWDQTAWSQQKQCVFKEEGNEYVAHCDHLTDFALLVASFLCILKLFENTILDLKQKSH